MKLENIITIEQLASELCVHKSWIYQRTMTGEIPHFKIGKYLRFDKKEIEKWLKKS